VLIFESPEEPYHMIRCHVDNLRSITCWDRTPR
jgi:hypothetical protein